MSDDFPAVRRRRDYVMERIETVPMTAEHYDQAVDALATLIVEWTASLRKPDGMTSDHSEVD